MKINKILILILFVIYFSGCDGWVSNIEPQIDRVTEDVLNTEGSVSLFVTGLANQTNVFVDNLTSGAGALSDELFFDKRNTRATFPSLENLDLGNPRDDEGDANQMYEDIHELRLLADTLIYKALNVIKFTEGTTGTTVKNRALYNGHFYAGYAYYCLATYYGKDENTGGSPVNKSKFKSATTLYNTAISRWKEALKYTTVAYDIRLINSLIARTFLFMGDYASAATHANLGLIKNDNPWTTKYNAENDNNWRGQAGEVRMQLTVDNRFNGYVVSDPTEAARLPLASTTSSGIKFYRQNKYLMQPDNTVIPIEIIDWQENHLMKAELIVRGAMTGNAIALINEIRASRIHKDTKLPVANLPATVNTITLADPVTSTSYSIYVERDKELWCRGNRMIDQRRFNKWHLATGWKYLPIHRNEKQTNPNWNVNE